MSNFCGYTRLEAKSLQYVIESISKTRTKTFSFLNILVFTELFCQCYNNIISDNQKFFPFCIIRSSTVTMWPVYWSFLALTTKVNGLFITRLSSKYLIKDHHEQRKELNLTQRKIMFLPEMAQRMLSNKKY